LGARFASATRRTTLALVVLGGLGPCAPARASDPEPPAGGAPADSALAARAAVERLHATLTDVMRRAEQLGYAGRQAELAPVIAQSFDLPLMARKAAGRYWKALSQTERERLVETFARLAVANYAGRFDGYAGERFETLSEEPAAHETLLVRTQLVRSDGDRVRLDYRLRSVAGSWRIFDVFLEGTVSEMALRRAEYSSVIRREGFEALLRALEAKIAAAAQDASS
jgi:phospholipid transport system substrate-binding protein